AERCKRNEVTVEFADPVDEAVAAGVGDKDVFTGTAVCPVFIGCRGVRHVVEAAGGGLVVVGVEEVVAPAAVEIIAAGAADEPIVAVVAEDGVVAIGVFLQRGGVSGVQWAVAHIEVEE